MASFGNQCSVVSSLARLSLPSPSRAPPPSPEASTSHPPPSQCRVRAGPCEDEDEDAQLGVGSCEAQCAGVRVGAQKVIKSGTRWGGGAGQQTASGFVVVRSGPWSAAARDGRSWVSCDWAAGGAAGEDGGCSPDEVGVLGEDGGCVAAVVEAADANGHL